MSLAALRRRLVSLLKTESVRKRIKLLKVYCGTTRFRILIALHAAGRPLPVSVISQVVGKPLSVTSHQLLVLNKAGLVTRKRKGREVHYGFRDGKTKKMLGPLIG